MTCADVAVRETKLACGARVSAWGAWRTFGLVRVGRVSESDGAWRCMEHVLVRQKIQVARGGACEVVFGRSWLGFARDCLFCHSMPLL